MQGLTPPLGSAPRHHPALWGFASPPRLHESGGRATLKGACRTCEAVQVGMDRKEAIGNRLAPQIDKSAIDK